MGPNCTCMANKFRVVFIAGHGTATCLLSDVALQKSSNILCARLLVVPYLQQYIK